MGRSFTPLVMSANGGFGRECKYFYAKLSEKIAEKRNEHYSVEASVKQKILFSLIYSIIISIRGSRTVANNEEIMIKSLSESIKTSKGLSEMDA